jgi:hypothetical protein
MEKETKVNPTDLSDQTDTDLVSLLQSMQQQLVHLEKKIDLLIGRSQERPSHAQPFGRRSFSKSPRPHDHSRYHDSRERESSPRNRDSNAGRFYERFPQKKERSSSPGRKSFAFKRKDRE